jgi:hypothetical protein
MTTGEGILISTALLALPATAVLCFGAGSLFTHRLMRGLPPVPPLPKLRRTRPAEPPEPEPDAKTYPKLRA